MSKEANAPPLEYTSPTTRKAWEEYSQRKAQAERAGHPFYEDEPSQQPYIDFIGAAERTNASATDAMNQQTQANRPSQYTPFASQEWIQDANGGWTQRTNLNPQLQSGLSGLLGQFSQNMRTPFSVGSGGQFSMGGPFSYGQPQAGQAYQPQQAQGAPQYGAQQATYQQAQQAPQYSPGTPFSFAGIPGQGQFDYGNLPGLTDGASARQQAIDAAYGDASSRLDPQWKQREQETSQQLLAQGLDPSSEAYQQAMSGLSRQRNDAYTGAMNSAIGQGTSAGSALFGQSLAARNQAMSQALSQRQQNVGEQDQGYRQALGTAGFNADQNRFAAGFNADQGRWAQGLNADQNRWASDANAGRDQWGAQFNADQSRWANDANSDRGQWAAGFNADQGRWAQEQGFDQAYRSAGMNSQNALMERQQQMAEALKAYGLPMEMMQGLQQLTQMPGFNAAGNAGGVDYSRAYEAMGNMMKGDGGGGFPWGSAVGAGGALGAAAIGAVAGGGGGGDDGISHPDGGGDYADPMPGGDDIGSATDVGALRSGLAAQQPYQWPYGQQSPYGGYGYPTSYMPYGYGGGW